MKNRSFPQLIQLLFLALALNSCSGQNEQFELLGSWQNVHNENLMEFSEDSIIYLNGTPHWNYQITSQNNILLLTEFNSEQGQTTTVSYDINQDNLLWKTNDRESLIYTRKTNNSQNKVTAQNIKRFINAEPQKIFTAELSEIIIAPGTLFAVSLPASTSSNISWQVYSAENIFQTGDGIEKRKDQNNLHHFGFRVDNSGEYLIEFILTNGDRVEEKIVFTITAENIYQPHDLIGKIRSNNSKNITLISNGEAYDFIVTSESMIELINIGETAQLSFYEDLENGNKYIIKMIKK